MENTEKDKMNYERLIKTQNDLGHVQPKDIYSLNFDGNGHKMTARLEPDFLHEQYFEEISKKLEDFTSDAELYFKPYTEQLDEIKSAIDKVANPLVENANDFTENAKTEMDSNIKVLFSESVPKIPNLDIKSLLNPMFQALGMFGEVTQGAGELTSSVINFSGQMAQIGTGIATMILSANQLAQNLDGSVNGEVKENIDTKTEEISKDSKQTETNNNEIEESAINAIDTINEGRLKVAQDIENFLISATQSLTEMMDITQVPSAIISIIQNAIRTTEQIEKKIQTTLSELANNANNLDSKVKKIDKRRTNVGSKGKADKKTRLSKKTNSPINNRNNLSENEKLISTANETINKVINPSLKTGTEALSTASKIPGQVIGGATKKLSADSNANKQNIQSTVNNSINSTVAQNKEKNPTVLEKNNNSQSEYKTKAGTMSLTGGSLGFGTSSGIGGVANSTLPSSTFSNLNSTNSALNINNSESENINNKISGNSGSPTVAKTRPSSQSSGMMPMSGAAGQGTQNSASSKVAAEYLTTTENGEKILGDVSDFVEPILGDLTKEEKNEEK